MDVNFLVPLELGPFSRTCSLDLMLTTCSCRSAPCAPCTMFRVLRFPSPIHPFWPRRKSGPSQNVWPTPDYSIHLAFHRDVVLYNRSDVLTIFPWPPIPGTPNQHSKSFPQTTANTSFPFHQEHFFLMPFLASSTNAHPNPREPRSARGCYCHGTPTCSNPS